MKITRSKVLTNISWLVGGRIIQMIFSFIVGILTARYLGPGNYGLINYGSVYTGIFTSICSLGLNSIVVKELIDQPEKQGETLGTIIGLKFVASILSLMSIFALTSIVDSGDVVTIQVVVLCSVGLVFQAFTIFEFWFQSKLQSKVSAIATMIAYIIVSVYRVVLLVKGCSVQWFAVATSIDYFCIALILYIAYRKSGGPRLTFSLSRSKKCSHRVTILFFQV
jgi:O-antigen/teichoic acid export membrane protein